MTSVVQRTVSSGLVYTFNDVQVTADDPVGSPLEPLPLRPFNQNHQRTIRMPPVVRHGAYYGLKAAESAFAKAISAPAGTPSSGPADSSSPPAEGQIWDYAAIQGEMIKRGRNIHFTPDEDDTNMMIRDAKKDPDALRVALLQNGLVMLKGVLATHVEKLLEKERAYQVLREAQYPQHRARMQETPQQGLHKPNIHTSTCAHKHAHT